LAALDERRKRASLLKFRHLDEMLSEVERLAEGRRLSSFRSARYEDLELEKKEAIREGATRVRKTMRRILEEKGIPFDIPAVHASRSINTILNFMDISAEEIRPKYMRGYGELTEEAAAELDAVATELQGLFKHMRAVLKKGWEPVREHGLNEASHSNGRK